MTGTGDSFWYPQLFDNIREIDIVSRFKYLMGTDVTKMIELFTDNLYIFMLTSVTALATFLIYYYLFLPWDFRRDLCDVGFDYLTDGNYRSVRHKRENKRELVREVQKLRKIGDIPPIYPNGWFALLESDELKTNEVKHVVALGENFAVFRNDKGEVKILDAYCPHLGANMAIGGKVRGNCVECPFHSWKFDGDTGHCTSVPYSEKTPDFVKVKKWKSVEANDFIFVWYHAENEEPSWYPKEIDVLKNKKWSFHGRSELLVGCHIQEIMENGADMGHFRLLHSPNILGGSDLRFYENFYSTFINHSSLIQWDLDPVENHKAISVVKFDTKIFNKYSIANIEFQTKIDGPGFLEMRVDDSWGTALLLMTGTPIEAMVTKVRNRIYAPYNHMIFPKLVLYGELVMFERDVMVWNHKKYQSKPTLVKEDKTISKYRKWYKQFYTENSPRFSFQKDTLAW